MTASKPPSRRDLPVPEWLDSLCSALSEGETMQAWCRRPGTPDKRTVTRWMRERQDVGDAIARAREDGVEVLVAELVSVARGPMKADGSYDADADTNTRVQRDRLRVDTLRWLCGVWDPQRMGPQAGRVGGGPVSVTVVTGVPDVPSNERQRLRLQVEEIAGVPLELGNEHRAD